MWRWGKPLLLLRIQYIHVTLQRDDTVMLVLLSVYILLYYTAAYKRHGAQFLYCCAVHITAAIHFWRCRC
jgi:hypothetical protein